MTEEEKIKIAAEILRDHLQDVEYSLVYERENLADESEDTWKEIHNLVNSAQIFVTWPEKDYEYQVAGAPD